MEGDRVESAIADICINTARNANHDPRADKFEKAVKRIKQDNETCEGNEGRDAARGQHPVIDLKHEQRAGEHQQIDNEAEHHNGNAGPTSQTQKTGNIKSGIHEILPHLVVAKSSRTPHLRPLWI
jgi:hypothetical protein